MMNNYTATISISPLSYLLCASGESRANVNAEFVLCKYGLPYFPGRRLKGLLKESLIEIMEITGEPSSAIVEKVEFLFGGEGDSFGDAALNFENLRLDGYTGIVNYLKQSPGLLDANTISSYFTANVQQTSIEDGIAKHNSLRNYNVLNFLRANKFSGAVHFISTKSLSGDDEKLLENAIAHLRYAGTRRNRGFGKIKCTINTFQKIDTNKVLTNLKSIAKIKVKIDCLEDVVLSTTKGEQNTVFSEDFISGNRLRGVLAGLYLRDNKADNTFKQIFLRRALKFNSCYLNGANPLPLNLKTVKYQKELEIVDVLKTKGKITKKVSGFIDDLNLVKVEKSYQFHNSRPNRSAGRSVQDNLTGGIFYYESITSGQSFSGTIEGESDALLKLLNAVGEFNLTSIGRSKSAQYGNIKILLSNDDGGDVSEKTNNKIYLVAQSPIVLLNNAGFPSPTLENLIPYFETAKISELDAPITTVEQFNNQWRSKSGKYTAFKEGACFVLEYENSPSDLPLNIGEWQDQGFGKLKYYSPEEMAELETSIVENADLSAETNSLGKTNTPQLVNKIIKVKDEEKISAIVRRQAIMDSSKLAKSVELSNSLIGRLNAILNLGPNEVKGFLKDIKSKPAGKVLDRYLLLDQLLSFGGLSGKYKSEKEYYIYWKTYMNNLRLQNKGKKAER